MSQTSSLNTRPRVRWRATRDQAGATSLAQTVIVAPVLLFALMLIVQFGLMFHAQNVAEQAAQDGAAAARRFDGSEAAARARAARYMAAAVSDTLTHQSILARRDATTASVTITGTVVSLVPGLHLRVRASASGPVERYVPPAAGAAP